MAEERLGDIIESIIRSRPGLRKELSHRQVLSRWKDIAGPSLARQVIPLEFRGNTLILGARGSVWAQEAEMFKDEILRRTSEEVGVGVVREIRIKVVSDFPGETGDEDFDAPSLDPEATPLPCEDADRDADAILEDMRIAHQRLRDSRRQAGWPLCPGCEEHYDPRLVEISTTGEELCPNCAREAHQEMRNLALRMVEELPWVDPKELRRKTGLEEEDCRSLKKERMGYWRGRVEESRKSITSGRRPLPDFRKRVLQVLMAEHGSANPSFEPSVICELFDGDVAGAFFGDAPSEGEKG